MVREICCNPEVSHKDINRYFDQCTCGDCRHAMQKVRLIATETEVWARKNMEISCYTNHISLCFWAGKRQHEVVVQMVNGKLEVETNINSWTAWLQAVVRRKFSEFKSIFFSIIGCALRLGAAAALKAITHG